MLGVRDPKLDGGCAGLGRELRVSTARASPSPFHIMQIALDRRAQLVDDRVVAAEDFSVLALSRSTSPGGNRFDDVEPCCPSTTSRSRFVRQAAGMMGAV